MVAASSPLLGLGLVSCLVSKREGAEPSRTVQGQGDGRAVASCVRAPGRLQHSPADQSAHTLRAYTVLEAGV